MKSVVKSTGKIAANIFALSVLAVFSANSSAQGDDTSRFYFQEVSERYFQYPQNARTFGMAGSTLQTSVNSSSILANPAGIGLMQGGEFSTTYSYNMMGGTEFPTGADIDKKESIYSGMVALPVGPLTDDLPEFGNFGIAWSGLDSKWDDDTFDTLTQRSHLVASYAYAVSPTFSLGYSFGWVEDRFQSRDIVHFPMHDGFRHTIGGVWKHDEKLMLGTSFYVGHGEHTALYGPGIEDTSDTREIGVAFGGEYLYNEMILAAGIDFRHLSAEGDTVESIPANIVGGNENGNIYNIRAGLENPINDWSVVRAGYRFAGLDSYKYNRPELNSLNGSANYHAVSAGVGFSFPSSSQYLRGVILDYGAEVRFAADNDFQHTVTLSVPFDLCG